MRLISAALAVALTPVFVALPTVSFASKDTPRPVAPSVSSTSIRGIDTTAARGLKQRGILGLAPGESAAAVAGMGPRAKAQTLSVLTSEQSRRKFTVAGVSWARSTDLTAADVTVQVRVKEARGWTDWETLPVPDDGPEASTAEAQQARLGTTPLVSEGATAIQVRVDTAVGRALPDLKVTTIDPGTSPADDDLTDPEPPDSATAAAVQPTIITRAQWGADERLRGPKTLSSTVKAITIHHTAGTNDYTQASAAAQVRGIYAYDTVGLGWADIAYNFLVDKWGRVYEGRAGSLTQPVRGAHSMGFNTDTMGIAAMGNYETAAAPAAMVDSLAKVAGWKLSQYGVDPLGTTRLVSQGGTGAKFSVGVAATLPTIHPHQNTSYTLCPGKYLTPQLPDLRQRAAMYAKYSSTTGPVPVVSARLYAAYGSLTLATGSTGWAVRDLQLELNRRGLAVGAPDGDYGAKTAAAVSAFQKAVGVVVTGRVTANDWKALSGLPYTKVPVVPVVPPPTPTTPIAGFDADGRGDVLGRSTTGDLYFYSTGRGTIGKPTPIGRGWQGFRSVLSPGDWSGDRIADVLALSTRGDLYLYRGNGKGSFASGGTLVARGWTAYTDLVASGDLTSDKRPDLVARKVNGELWLIAGDGKGGFGTPRRIGAGWQGFTQLITPGDLTGDGHPDLLARTAAGALYLYAGNGSATTPGYRPGVLLGRGWQVYNTVISTGDLTGDGKADLLARTPKNQTYVYAGTGGGRFMSAKPIAAPWLATTQIFGVR